MNMEWIKVNDDNEIPVDKNIIVEDCNGWIGHAYHDSNNWRLETFGQAQTNKPIYFDKIIRYFVLPEPPKD